ncbi:hypothetical protein AXG93_2637s1090 [Marchantia polymorpha subsp. ruderalis]|uniref:Bifunctional inhibitor/plant lipid transfer protein/seed storage helical domain-containing protein n=1 Tax=Marchantia polymorpha subsp. ruderalis TaxID=1480154 RepID=A0A176VFA5_MARPO|nr:hypothetical protein AXG93_2637s1090 [Marchantia polymorpha subsp. ruderalis]
MELAGDTPEMGTGAAAAAGGNECGAGPRGDTPVGLGDGTGSMIPSSFGEGYLSPLGDSGGTSSSRAYLMGAGAAGAQRAELRIMSRFGAMSMVLLVTALCFAPSGLGQTTPAPAPQLDCTDALTDLLPCLDYVTNSSPNISAECCTGLGAVKASNPLCLCTFLNANQSASLGINVTRALELPTFCKVQANPADCGGSPAPVAAPVPSSGPAPPNPTPSPSTPPAPVEYRREVDITRDIVLRDCPVNFKARRLQRRVRPPITDDPPIGTSPPTATAPTVAPTASPVKAPTMSPPTAVPPPPVQDCNPQLTQLASCLAFVTGQSSPPSAECCSNLGGVVETAPSCLCTLLEGGVSGLNTTLAMQLPMYCNVEVNPDNCSGGSAVPGPAAAPVAGNRGNSPASTTVVSPFLTIVFVAAAVLQLLQ